jgi:hypothetical protein
VPLGRVDAIVENYITVLGQFLSGLPQSATAGESFPEQDIAHRNVHPIGTDPGTLP